MKRTYASLLRFLCSTCCFSAILAVSSCTKQPVDNGKKPPVPEVPSKIVISATTIDRMTRLEVTDDIIHSKWSADDEMGLFVKFNDEWSKAALYAVENGSISNDGTAATFKEKSPKESEVFKWREAGSPHLFYAYAPRKVGDTDPTAIPISLPNSQKQDGVGYADVSKYNFMVAEPVQCSAPRSFNDATLDKPVHLRLRGAFAILEFRFGSFEDETANSDVRVHNISLKSDLTPLAVTEGTIDITQPTYATDFAKVKASEANFRNEVTLEIENPTEVPLTQRKYVIPGNNALKPIDIENAFPARMVVLPNESTGNTWIEDSLTLTVGYTIDGVAKEYTRRMPARRLKTGERHAITCVLPIKPGSTQAPPEDKGAPWDGVTKTEPSINVLNKTITITSPAELAWFAHSVNQQTIAANVDQLVYDGYTLQIENNINLGNHHWVPIGFDGVRYFRGHVNGNGHVVSGLNITAPDISAYTDKAAKYAYFGLFGIIMSAPESGAGQIKGLRVEGKIEVPKSVSGAVEGILRVGGVVASLDHCTISQCGFEGSLTAYFSKPDEMAGIVGYLNGGMVKECTCKATIKLYSGDKVTTILAGVVGRAPSSGSIQGCGFEGSIEVDEFAGLAKGRGGAATVGGILASGSIDVSACRNSGSIHTYKGMDNIVGGVVGQMIGGTVQACYNTGKLTTDDGRSYGNFGCIGGVVGDIAGGLSFVRACYNRGEINPSSKMLKWAGNIVGGYSMNTKFNYSQITDNFFSSSNKEDLTTDKIIELDKTSIKRFGPQQWPNPNEMAGWGTGDGSGANKYWNVIFPTSFGTMDWEYPQLYWEVIE